MKLYLSVPEKQHTMNEVVIMQNLKGLKLLGNVTQYKCTVQNKKTNQVTVENGFCIEIFKDNHFNSDSIFEFWINVRTLLHLNCAWIEWNDFSGCISEAKAFQQYCAINGHKNPACGEY